MCIEKYGDYFLTFYAGRCINCGAIVDRTLLSNNDISGEPSPSMTMKQF
jgi:hypothetical protein